MATPFTATRTVTRSSVGTPTVKKTTKDASYITQSVSDAVKKAKAAQQAAKNSGFTTSSGNISKNLSDTLGSENVSNSSMLYGNDETMQEAQTGSTIPTWLKYAPVIEEDDTSGVSASSYYNKYLKEQQKAIQKKIDASVQANNAYIPEINQASDQSLQNAYILREQNRVNAPQALSAMGYTGGATETSMMGINTGYENTRNEVEQNRAKSLAEIQQNEAQIRATGDATLSDAAATYYQNLIASQKEAEAAAQAQANWQAQYDLSEQQYSDAAAQQQWENAYNEKLLAAKNATTAKSSSGGSSGSSSRGTSSSSGSTNKNSSGNYNTVLTNVKRALGGSNAGSTVSWNAAINYIQNSLKSGMITDYEANQMINQLGLN